MKRITALCMILLLLLTACAAPTDEEEILPSTNVPSEILLPSDTTASEAPEENNKTDDPLPEDTKSNGETEEESTGQDPSESTTNKPQINNTNPSAKDPVTNTNPSGSNSNSSQTKPEKQSQQNTPASPSGDKDEEENKEFETSSGSIFDDSEYKDYTTSCMTFNVLAYNTGGSTPYSHPAVRAPWVLDTIKKYNPDLLGCQEVIKKVNNSENYDMYTYLTTNLAKLGYTHSGLMDSKGKANNTVSVNDYTIASGLVIFWKRDRFELKDFGAKVYTNDSGRHFQWVKLYDKEERITILMTNTHMSINPNKDVAKGDEIRAQQANQLYQFWYGNCRGDMALYATGDYNHKTSTTAFGNLTKGEFVSTRDISQSSNADSGIDHVFINGEIQDCFKYIRCNETYEPAGVAKSDPNKRNTKYCASDHYAVIAYCSNAYR